MMHKKRINDKTTKKGKYNNIKTNGYDSNKEYLRSLELKQNIKEGHISDLQEQVKFILIPKQCGERQCTYIADFTYYDSNGNYIVEDVKGVRTEVYKIKKKLMLYIHGIKIKEV